jgi:hypothetical protein
MEPKNAVKNLAKNFLLLILIFVVISVIFNSFFQLPIKKEKELSITELTREINAGKIKSITVTGNDLLILYKDGTTTAKSRKETELAISQSLINFGADKGKLAELEIIQKEEGGQWSWLAPLLLSFLPFLILGFFLWMIFRQAKSGTMQAFDFTKARARLFGTGGLQKEKVTFKDVAGLKEALHVGTENAVSLTGKMDGYFRNEAIKILMPEKMQTLEKGLRAVGYGPQVDEFVLSMNRAAEKAAPFGKQIFWDAIGEMTFDDVRKILSGHETAATDYFKGKTTDKLTVVFKPPVSNAMNEVGVTRQYKELTGR